MSSASDGSSARPGGSGGSGTERRTTPGSARDALPAPTPDAARARLYETFFEITSDAIWCSEYRPAIDCSLPPAEQASLIYERSRIVHCNAGFLRAYGIPSAEDVIGEPLARFFHKTPDWERLAAEFVGAGYRVVDGESREELPDGSVHVYLNCAYGVVEDGALTCTWGTLRDISALKQAEEEQLFQAQKLEAVGQLAGGIAHEFNNLLQAISGYAEIIRLDMPSPRPRISDCLDQIGLATGRAANLTQKLLTFSQQEAAVRREFRIQDYADDVAEILGQLIGEQYQLELSVAPALPPVIGNPSQIQQLLIDLCLNARDAMRLGGRIEVDIRKQSVTAQEAEPLGLKQAGEHIRISVRDHGAGIPPEYRDRVFDPFFTSKEVGEGPGLGLSTVYAIARSHAGVVDFMTEEGLGTDFRVLIPTAPRQT